MSRCTSTSPIYKGDLGPVRCDGEAGHKGDHYGISYDRSYEAWPCGEPRTWSENPPAVSPPGNTQGQA